MERAEQLEELLRSWAWRLKRRRLSKIPIPSTPDLTDLLPRLLRYSSTSIQELWAVERHIDQTVLWLEEPSPQLTTISPPGTEPSPNTFGLPPHWAWTQPSLLKGISVFPLRLFQPIQTASDLINAHPPDVQLAYARDTAGLWEHGGSWLTRFETPNSLLIRSDHPSQNILIRKLLFTLFDWHTTRLIDLEESPLTLIGLNPSQAPLPGSTQARLAEEQVGILSRKLLEKCSKRSIVILCDTVTSGFEAALLKLLLSHLTEAHPLFICLEPSEHIPFTWILREDIAHIRTVTIPSRKPEPQARKVLGQISRLLEVIPDKLTLEQIRPWFEPEDQLQLETCIDRGYLREKSGQIMVADIMTSSENPSTEIDEIILLQQADTLFQSPLIQLKLNLLNANEAGVKTIFSTPAQLLRLQQDPSALIKLLNQTEQSWGLCPSLVMSVAEICLCLLLLGQADRWLKKLPLTGNHDERTANLKSRLSQAIAYSPDGLFQMALDETDIPADERPKRLSTRGLPALSILAETDILMTLACDEEAESHLAKLNDQLFRVRCIGTPDLQVWISLAWAHWHLGKGSPAKAAALLRDCLPLCQESLLTVQPSLNLCETLLGHWNGCSETWPQSLPGGFLPPDKGCWAYLHLLLQHRFPEAETRYRETIAHQTAQPTDPSRTSAGLCPANMVLLHNRLTHAESGAVSMNQSLPPWLMFIHNALRPFYLPAETQACHTDLSSSTLVTHDRNYFYYEHHYLRYHDPLTILPTNGEERDLFFDTCAYFSRRGRSLSSTIETLRSRLATAAIRENRSSGSLLVQSAHKAPNTQDLLRTALGILQSRFSAPLCVIRLLKQDTLLHTAGSPADSPPLADHLFSSTESAAEELLIPETLGRRLPDTIDPFVLSLGSLHLFRLPAPDETLSLQVLLGFTKAQQPGMPLYDRLQRCLSPLMDFLNQNRQLSGPSPLDDIIGDSPIILALKRQIQKVSRVDFTVTIRGESGTGKELIARSIHHLSRRRDKPFIAFNCASLPETLLEAELMGVMKGAFTDARENRAGLIESAEGGTLFLDEIGEMPLLLQAKLLRFLSDHTIRRLGENQLRQVDCRILCATHRDLREMVTQKIFREDLFYRIHELTVMSPPLRHRREDLPLLLDHFIQKYGFKGLSQTKKHWLALKWMHLDWPGNVRELESRVKELITYYPHHPDIEDLTPLYTRADGTLHHSRQQFERICLLNSLEKNSWNRNQSAASLGISRIALFKLMRKHKLKDPENPASEF